jgi:hypothetical protein
MEGFYEFFLIVFQATWHPLQDLIVCGRYPDKNVEGSTGFELRTLDIFDADTGKIVSQLYSQGTDGLCPVSTVYFNFIFIQKRSFLTFYNFN